MCLDFFVDMQSVSTMKMRSTSRSVNETSILKQRLNAVAKIVWKQ